MENKICPKCNINPIKCKNLCTKCYGKEHSALKRKEARDLGLCIICRKNPLVSKARCQICLDKRREKSKECISNGLCGSCCKRPLLTKVCCEQCAKNRRGIRKKLIALGLCGECGSSEKITKFHCQNCLDKCSARHLNRKKQVFEAYGGFKCACCGETEEVFLSIDHINGGGGKHRREIGNGLYGWLKKNNFPPGFQVLCMNCQRGKYICGICPHQKNKPNI